MYAERGTECSVPRETERQYGCNPSYKHAASLCVINTVINLIPVTLKSTPSQYTSILHTKEILLLEVLNFTLFFLHIFAVSPPSIFFILLQTRINGNSRYVLAIVQTQHSNMADSNPDGKMICHSPNK